MAELVDVYRPEKALSRRQLPLVVDETLTMVMDLKSLGLISDSQPVKLKELEHFASKVDMLSQQELDRALEVSRTEVFNIFDQEVPCVGCRRSVERLFNQLFEYPTFDPLVITADGIVTVRKDKKLPQFLCSLFHEHSTKLNNLIDNQLRRNKKSLRCQLHSLDSQRGRPITLSWRDVWDCMHAECKRDVCIIEASSLRTTLETYLRKHRFCGECRTKVQKAYSLLIEDPEPCKEKGYVTGLYAGIKRCIQEKHIHLEAKTAYIAKLISRAEPELLGRERHAKTLEIAQEEVLTCIGICVSERLHRIHQRLREEECMCQVFAAVAVEALCRRFETAVESKKGVMNRGNMLMAELNREQAQKQNRREQKKLKRKRKKDKMLLDQSCNECNEDSGEFDEKEDQEKDCSCDNVEKTETLKCVNCGEVPASSRRSPGGAAAGTGDKKNGGGCEPWLSPCKEKKALFKCDNFIPPTDKETCHLQDQSHDYGYSSENNNNGCCETESPLSCSLASSSSSPEGSELAWSDTCCRAEDVLDGEEADHAKFRNGLQAMLDTHCYCDDTDCYITPEEVREFQSNNRQVYEERQQLRETLRKRFAQLCATGNLQVPQFLVQSKYTTN